MTKVVEFCASYPHLTKGDLQNEIWADIEGFEGDYQISNMGRGKSLKGISGISERILKPQKVVAGYLYISMWKDGLAKNKFLHRLVGKYFVPNPENKPQINHKKGFKWDNRANELEWATSSENLKHAHSTGLKKPTCNNGESIGTSKLKTNDIFEIRNLINDGVRIKVIALKFNVSFQTISAIKTGASWAHV